MEDEELQESILNGAPVLRLVGYWSGPDAGAAWPDVHSFVDADASPHSQEALADDLDDGLVLRAAAGYSSCRICGVPNGSTELTNGLYVWPEGLGHYVRKHSVRLPDMLISGIRNNVPPKRDAALLLEVLEAAPIDTEWWRTQVPAGS